MGILPVPGKMYLNDFPDKSVYSIYRSGDLIAEAEGLTNSDEDGNHIAFLYGTDVIIGDIIQAKNGKSYTINFLPFRKSVPTVYWNYFSCMFIQVAWSGYTGSLLSARSLQTEQNQATLKRSMLLLAPSHSNSGKEY